MKYLTAHQTSAPTSPRSRQLPSTDGALWPTLCPPPCVSTTIFENDSGAPDPAPPSPCFSADQRCPSAFFPGVCVHLLVPVSCSSNNSFDSLGSLPCVMNAAEYHVVSDTHVFTASCSSSQFSSHFL